MANDKEKLLKIMKSLESDYRHGKISEEKYRYFRSKYEDKLNALDARAATNRIRSMQGKPSNNQRGVNSNRNRKEEQDLVQKYIINPKKGDNKVDEKKGPMDSGTFKLVLVLVLVLGFTVGIGYGVFNFDFESVADSDSVAIVEDTAFPDVEEYVVNETVTNSTTTQSNTTTTSDTSSSNIESYSESSSSSSSSSQYYSSSSSSSSSSYDSGSGSSSYDSGSGSEGGSIESYSEG